MAKSMQTPEREVELRVSEIMETAAAETVSCLRSA